MMVKQFGGDAIRWSYKTELFELKKDGLLGSAFLDDAEIEETLNEFGRAGWELVSMFETRDGVLAVFKQALGRMEAGEDLPESGVERVAEELDRCMDAPPEPARVPEPLRKPRQPWRTEEAEGESEEEMEQPMRSLRPRPARPYISRREKDAASQKEEAGAMAQDEEDDSGIGSIRIE